MLTKLYTNDSGFDMMTKALPREKFEVWCKIASLAVISTKLSRGDLLGIRLPSYVEKDPKFKKVYLMSHLEHHHIEREEEKKL